jgi:hypothetical protein
MKEMGQGWGGRRREQDGRGRQCKAVIGDWREGQGRGRQCGSVKAATEDSHGT